MNRHATAVWKGALADGKGTIDTQSGAFSSVPYSFRTRFEDEEGHSGTNPEELIAAAHSACFAMQLSHLLAENGTPPERLEAKAVVSLAREDGGFSIRSSALELQASVSGIAQADFQELAEKAKSGCPVSRALGAITVTLDARLV
ncbi:OsmC family protein [Zhengella sp. ZM62]|uniref:OsmC family protein n=1 Tax=Zhengella sedimenti TaxID=3390035 RepID=UPI003976D87E